MTPNDPGPNRGPENIEIDTFNKFFVGAQGEQITFLKRLPQQISKADALLLAAYLVAMADDNGEFPIYLAAVRNT